MSDFTWEVFQDGRVGVCHDFRMPHGHLTAYVDAWTIKAVMASRLLTRLYRVLGDERQATLAIQAGAPTMERMFRLGLQARIPAVMEAFALEHPDEPQAEQAAWMALIEAQTGLAAFYAISNTSDAKPVPGLRGSRTATYGALRKAIRGIHTAFPEAMANEAVSLATKRAVTTCVDAFLNSIEGHDCGNLDQIRADLDGCVREALETTLGYEGWRLS